MRGPMPTIHRPVFRLLLLGLTVALFWAPLAYGLSALPENQLELKQDVKKKVKVSVSTKQSSLLWISTVGQIYMRPSLSDRERGMLFALLRSHLGIRKDGTLDVTVARQASHQLSRYTHLKKRPFTRLYFDDKLNLTGYNYIYLETCLLNRSLDAPRFVSYFERGFYPNRALFLKEEHYYKSLYYYLYLTQGSLVTAVDNAVATLSANPKATPDFSMGRIKSLETTVAVCSELDNLKHRSPTADSPWARIFTESERTWIEGSISYFTGIETHVALSSYDWFKRSLPLSIGSRIISHNIRQSWEEQSASHRTILPLMLFMDHGSKQFSVEKLFQETLSMLKMDNREVDLVVLSAMKSWLLKQIRQGIKVGDRSTYKQILDELNVCPSGWIFYNLYSCRPALNALKQDAAHWETLPVKKRQELFETRVEPNYRDAKTKIDMVFSDLEMIFGEEEIYGGQYKASSINHLFHRYRGEIDYTFEFLQSGLYGDDLSQARLPLANTSRNCLHDFTAAFVKAPQLRINHVNLLNAYTLLFRELAAQGKVGVLSRHEKEMEEFILSDTYRLGSALKHEEDSRYAIYGIIADAYLSNPRLKTRALKVAERSLSLARSYYTEAARREGFISGALPGALSTKATEVDDYERQYERFQAISEALGKRALLLLPREDVELYNRMQDVRNPEGYLL